MNKVLSSFGIIPKLDYVKTSHFYFNQDEFGAFNTKN